MIKAVLIGKKRSDTENILNYFQNSTYINFIGAFDNFEEISFDVDLIIFDINKENKEYIINEIKNIKPEIKLIAISDEFDNSLINDTKKYVCDFLFMPIIPAILEASIKKIDFNKTKEKNTIEKAKIIGFYSLTNGIGKTSCAINIAFELSKNKNVCLLDFNSNSPDCSLYLGLKQQSDIEGLTEQIQKSDKETALSLIEKYNSLYVLSARKSNAVERKYNEVKIIKFLENIFDYILIDTYCNIDKNNLSILSACDLIMYISILSKNAVEQTNQALEMFSKIGYNQNKIKIILNRYIENSEVEQKEVNGEIFATIPNNFLALSDAINRKSPLDITNPQSKIAKAYKEIAQKIDKTDIQKENFLTYSNGIFDIIRQRGE